MTNPLRRALVFAILFLAAAGLSAEIGESFEAGGIAFSGSASVEMDLGLVLDDTDESFYWNLRLQPEADLFVKQNLSIWVGPYFYTETDKVDPDTYYRYARYGLFGGARYYFVSDPSAMTGLVPALGLGIYANRYHDLDDKVAGVTDPDETSWISIGFTPQLRLYSFLTHRVAISFSVEPTFDIFYLATKDDAGNKVELDFDQRFHVDVAFWVGFAWFVPVKDAILVEK